MTFKKSLLLIAFSLCSLSLFATDNSVLSTEVRNFEEGDVLAESIIRAIEMGDINTLRILMEENSENLEKEIYQNMTSLVVALAYLSRGFDTREVIKCLLELGADTKRIVFTAEGKEYNVLETVYNMRENLRRNQEYLVQLEKCIEDVIAMLES